MEILQCALDIRSVTKVVVLFTIGSNVSEAYVLSFMSADKEFLHKTRDGNVFLHNVETKEESLYLSNSTFVIFIHLHL